MLERERHIKELYDLKHIHDTNINQGFDYEKNLLNMSISPVMAKNDETYTFLQYLQQQMVVMWESVLVIRNFYNYSVDRLYNKHNN